ncbi:ATPase P [Opitutaceae bacterium EW11]|nr:ATPase P [Opitutaceae bacterium EW11]
MPGAASSSSTDRRAAVRSSRAQRTVCRHCGVPTAGPEQEFCCAGCAYVYRLIQEEGLGAYYQIKDKVTSPADSALLPPREYRWLAEAQVKAETEAAGHTPELRLDVQGLSCAGCVWLIERLFNKQSGAGRIDINAQTGQMRLSWQKGFDAAAFGQTLQQFNYFVSPASAARSAPPESRGLVKRIGLCAAFAMNVMLFTLPTYFGMDASFEYARLFGTISMGFATLSLLAGGGFFIGKAFRALREGAINIDLPIALGILGAYLGSAYGWLAEREAFVYFDFVATFILLMLVGRWAQLAAVERNQRRLLAEQPAPPSLRAWKADGTPVECTPDELTSGMRFSVGSGMTVAVEGRLMEEEASMSLAWINGESAPRTFRRGQRVPSGAINLGRSDVVLEATQAWRQSLLAELTKPAKRTTYRDRFLERVITGYLVAMLATAFLSGLFWWLKTHDAARSCSVVTAVLVVSCPCAIGLAFPLADETATIALRKRGVFVRVPDLWPRLARLRKLVFDKTGTLTLETPRLRGGTVLEELSVDATRALFTLVSDNPHPIGRCLHEQLLARGGLVGFSADVQEQVGQGARFVDAGVEWRLGRPQWAMTVAGVEQEAASKTGTDDEEGETVLSRNGVLVAAFRFEESVRTDAVGEIAKLRARGLQTVVLSGDRRYKVERLTRELGLGDSAGQGELSPHDKAAWVEAHGADDALMLGDGANDSLAFDRALCRGTPVIHRGVLAEKADFYYLGCGIGGIRALFEVNDARRRTHGWLLAFSIAYNLLAVGLAAAGRMSPLLAAILMPASSLLTLVIVGWGMKPSLRAIRG